MSVGLNSFGLDAFFICAQEKNFTRAAERLHMTQSALSQRIKNLESDIGTTLFIRDRIGVRLTEAGEALLRYCHNRNQLEQELVGQISNNQQQLTGQLRIGGYSSVLRSILLPTCQALLKNNSHIQVQLVTKEMNELPELLKNASVDFLILDHKIEKEGLKAVLLGHEHNIRIRKKGTEFSGFFLDHDADDETTLKYLKLKTGAKLKRHFLDDIYGIMDGVHSGWGDAIVPLHLIENRSGFEIIDPKITLKNPVYLHFYEQPIPSKLQSKFIESLLPVAKKILLED